MIYVRMTDKALSGWGNAKGRTAVFVVECDTRAQADAIERAAQDRPEMIRINMSENRPRATTSQTISFRRFVELGAIWKKYYIGE
jgi:hypothetical protein